MASRKLEPIHPGEVLASEFLEPLGLSQYRLAQDRSVPPRRINEIVHGQRAITAGPLASPSRQSPWNGHTPTNPASRGSRSTYMWPISG